MGKFLPLCLKISDLGVIEAIKIDFQGKDAIIVKGNNGAGKSKVIDGLEILWDGVKKLSKMDNPVRQGAKKFEVSLEVQGEKGTEDYLDEFGIKTNHLIFIATKKPDGKLQFRVKDADTNKTLVSGRHKDIMSKFRETYLHPQAVIDTLMKKGGDLELSEIVCKHHGLDFTEDDERDQNLSEQFTLCNSIYTTALKKREDKEQYLPNHLPREEWPDKEVDLSEFHDAKTEYSEFNAKEKQKKLLIESATQNNQIHENNLVEIRKGSDQLIDEALGINNEVGELSKEVSAVEKDLSEYVEKNPIVPSKTEELKKQLAELQIKITESELIDQKNQTIKDHMSGQGSVIEIKKANLKSKSDSLVAVNSRIQEKESLIKTKEADYKKLISEHEELKTQNAPVEWKGLKDPFDIKTVPEYIDSLMEDTLKTNEFFKTITEYDELKIEEATALKNKDDVFAQQKQSKVSRRDKITQADISGFDLDEKSRLLMEDVNGNWNTLKDLSKSDQAFAAYKLMLNYFDWIIPLITLNEAYRFTPDRIDDVIDAANEKEITPILEVFEYNGKRDYIELKSGSIDNVEKVQNAVNEIVQNGEQHTTDWG